MGDLRPARAWGRAGIVVALVLVADQVSKRLVDDGIPRGTRRAVAGPLDLVNVRNTGVAFGALGEGGALVLALTAVALVAVLVWFVRRPGRPGAWLATGLLVGGALGNLVDRLREGAVTDFVKLPHWPAFNLADTAITLGVVTLFFVVEAGARRRGE